MTVSEKRHLFQGQDGFFREDKSVPEIRQLFQRISVSEIRWPFQRRDRQDGCFTEETDKVGV